MIRNRSRWLLVPVMALMAAIPGAIAFGQTDAGSDSPFQTVGELVLHLDGNDSYFEFDGLRQYVAETRCVLEVAPPGDTTGFAGPFAELVTFEGTSGRGPGTFDDGIGAKTGGAQGVDCSRVDSREVLVIGFVDVDSGGTPGPLAGLTTKSAEFDVEIKQDAEVVATTFVDGAPAGTYTLRTGGSIVAGEGTDADPATPWLARSTAAAPIANCADRSDSGSDAGANDNCRWVIEAGLPFDEIHLTALQGEFTLEGGADGTPANPLSATVGSDTVFVLTEFDGILDCGDTVRVGDGVTTPEGIVTRLEFFTTPECVLKPYTLDSFVNAGGEFIEFIPQGEVVAHYSAALTFLPYAESNPISQQLEYDPGGGFVAMQWCVSATVTTTVDAGGEIVRTVTEGTLPVGETWCIAASDTVGVGGGLIHTTWWVYGEDDPNFKVR